MNMWFLNFYGLFAIIALLVIFLKQVNQYERGVMFTMGRYTGMKDAGWRLVIPVFQKMRKVDVRVKAVDVPNQKAITKDNIAVGVNGGIYYKVSDSSHALFYVENF